MVKISKGSYIRFKRHFKNGNKNLLFRVVDITEHEGHIVYNIRPLVYYHNPFYSFFMNPKELEEHCIFGPALDVLYGGLEEIEG